MSRSEQGDGGGADGGSAENNWYATGLILMSRGDLEKASECFERALQEEPHNESAWFNWGVVLGRMGLHDEAMLCYDTAVKVGEVGSGAAAGDGAGVNRDGAPGAGELTQTMDDISSGNYQGIKARSEVEAEPLYFGDPGEGGGRAGDGLVPGPKRKVAKKKRVKGVRTASQAPRVKSPESTAGDDPLLLDVDRALESLREEGGGCVYMELDTKLMLNSSVKLMSHLTGPKGMKGILVSLTSPAEFYLRLAAKSGVEAGEVMYIDASGSPSGEGGPAEEGTVYVDTQDDLAKLTEAVGGALETMGSRDGGAELFVLFDDGAALTLFHSKREVKRFFMDFTKYASDRGLKGFILMRTDSLAETMEEFAEEVSVVGKGEAPRREIERERA